MLVLECLPLQGGRSTQSRGKGKGLTSQVVSLLAPNAHAEVGKTRSSRSFSVLNVWPITQP